MGKNLQGLLGPYYDKMILAGYVGSISHGTNLHRDDPNNIDDRDVMVVYVEDEAHYLGFPRQEHFRIQEGIWDIVGYEVRKYFRLLLKSNPNVLGLLWLRPEHYLCRHELGDALIGYRNIFSSLEAYKSFCGYANGQMHKMTRGSVFEGYMGAKRKALVEKYGYDVKNASHMIRLLNMGYEFLTTGQINVFREHDNQTLIEIKTGKWPLHRVLDESDRLFGLIKESLLTSVLPPRPDTEGAEQLLVAIVKQKLWSVRGVTA